MARFKVQDKDHFKKLMFAFQSKKKIKKDITYNYEATKFAQRWKQHSKNDDFVISTFIH